MTLPEPQNFTFQVTLESGGQMHLEGVPEDENLIRALAQTIAQMHPPGEAWAERYRAYRPLFPDLPDDVPGWRRFKGELSGLELRLTDGEISHDGETWTTFPVGAPRYVVTHWLEGRIDIEPDPPEDDLDTIEDAARALHGETEATWAKAHAQRDSGGDVPVARRTVFELRPGGYEAVPDGAAYSPDGEEWHAYDPAAESDADDLSPFAALEQMFGDMLDVDTVQVTVEASGRVSWADGDIPEEHADRIRADLREATGAGHPQEWAEWTAEVLSQTFGAELDVPEGQSLPVPVAVRLDIPRDAIDDPDPLAQTFMESEVSFDGVIWRDLFSEEVPEELATFRAGQDGN